MISELDKILILPSQPDYQEKREMFFQNTDAGGRFAGYDCESNRSLLQIIRDVVLKGDKAISEYTLKLDNVQLRPEQFRVADEELNNAHKAIDKKLLKSIRQAIKNVRQYQSKILSVRTGISNRPVLNTRR